MASYEKITNTLNFAVALNPTTAFPLDARSMFGSLAAATAAAATAENAGSSNTVYYYGQTLTVFENDVATQYIIQGDKTLKEVGSSTLGDDKTIVLENNTLSLKDFGSKYYAYHDADTIISTGDYTYPDNMPADAADGSYIQIANVWYKYTVENTTWSVYDGTPHATSWYELITGWKAGLEPKVVSEGNDYALAWYEPSKTTVEGLNSAVSSLQTEVGQLKTRTDTLEPKVAKNETDIAAEVTRATGAEGALDTRVTATETAITTLNADATTAGSVAKQVADAIAKIVADAPESLDTLKEISDWISTHQDDAAAMNSSIIANTTAINALTNLVGTLPDGTKATTVIDYIAEAIKVETDRATAAEAALDGRITAVETEQGKLGTAAYNDTNDFATAAQGAKADNAVQEVTAGVNGHLSVDGTDVVAYDLPSAKTDTLGGIKPDGTSISVSAEGVASIEAVDYSKVTGLPTQLTSTKESAVADAKTYGDETFLGKTDVVASGDLASSVDTASDTKAASEKALVDLFTWKTTM